MCKTSDRLAAYLFPVPRLALTSHTALCQTSHLVSWDGWFPWSVEAPMPMMGRRSSYTRGNETNVLLPVQIPEV